MARIQDLNGAAPGSVRMIDIRKKTDERQIPGSERYNGEQMETAQRLPFQKGEHVVLYCGSGNSCSRIAQTPPGATRAFRSSRLATFALWRKSPDNK